MTPKERSQWRWRRAAHAPLKLRIKLLVSILTVLTVSSACSGGDVGDEQAARREQISRFLENRKRLSPLCLYTFDETKMATTSTSIAQANSTTQAFYESHLPSECPFGDLQFDPTLVTSLNIEAHSHQLGVRITKDPEGGDSARVQIASTDFASAQDFYTRIVDSSQPEEGGHDKRTGGVTFEMVLRRHASSQNGDNENGGMTLFSIANVHDGCVDSGFRVDVDKDRRLVLVYSLPMQEADQSGACYEALLISSLEDAVIDGIQRTCRFPEPKSDVSDNPPVYIAVTIDPASTKLMRKTEFQMTYTDPATLENVNCRVPAQFTPPYNSRLHRKSITGNLQLFIGNSPRNVSAPKVRRAPAPMRKFRPLSSEDMNKNATERLRSTLLDKLMSIKGPQIPEAMRILGDKSFSLKLFGVEFPPVNEDTPLAYLRGKLRDFLVKNGDKMVDHMISMLRKAQPVVEEPQMSRIERIFQNAIEEQNNASMREAYSSAQTPSSFDLFHFAIYRKPLTATELDDRNWTHLGPFRPMPTLTQELRIQEDEVVLLDLVQLHSVYDDVQLELRALPEFGKLMLYPNKTVVTSENMASFRELPIEYQKKIYFQPNPDENNENLPLPNPVAFSRRRRAYSDIEFGVYKSITDRKVNGSAVATISIFVNAVNDAPRPLHAEQRVVIEGVGLPVVLDLKGEDSDGSSPPPVNKTEGDGKEKKKKTNIFDQMTDALDFSLDALPSNAPPPPPRQFVKVTRLPRFGKLYDRHLASQNESLLLPIIGYDRSRLEKYRIALDDIANGSFSTNLVYAYGGWGQDQDRAMGVGSPDGEEDASDIVVDELWYRLNDGEAGVYSDAEVVKFAVNTTDGQQQRSQTDSNCLKIVQLKEDSSIVVALAEIEPLIGLLDARTKFRITELPQHGALYQFHEAEGGGGSGDGDVISDAGDSTGSTAGDQNSSSTGAYRIGKKIDNVNRVVDDVNGRLVYIPERDYYNMLPQVNETTPVMPTSFGLDSFAFEPEDTSEHMEPLALNRSSIATSESSSSNSASSRPLRSLPFDALRPRVIQIQVVSEPDELILVPPTYFVANQSLGESVHTPVHFDDPDALYEGLYQVTVKAKDGFSRFDLGADVNNDDLMKFCNLTRPCLLARSIDPNRTAEQKKLGGEDEVDDKKLLFYMQHMIHTPSHIIVLGKKKAMQQALSNMTFTDWATSFMTPHRAKFTIKIKRIDETSYEPLSKESKATYYVDYPPLMVGGFAEMTEKLVHMAMNQVLDFIWTLIVSVLVCVLITNASCFKSGFCCCCSRAREQRRRKFEDEQTRFYHQVAQNDYEYSMLIVDIADMILEPNLAFATSLVRCLPGSDSPENGGAHLRVFCLRSLIPVLETERQATRFVFRLMVLEFEQGGGLVGSNRMKRDALQRGFLGGSSCAGMVLAFFCRYVGKHWLKKFMVTPVYDDSTTNVEPDEEISGAADRRNDSLFTVLLEKLSLAIVDLPVEIVILCRACVKLFEAEPLSCMEPSHSLLRVVHLVFFNHFIGPALLYGGDEAFGVCPNSEQRQRLIEIANHFTRLTQRWDVDSHGSQQKSQWSGNDCVLLSEDEEQRVLQERLQLKQYEMLLYIIADASALQSSYEPQTTSTTELKHEDGYPSAYDDNSTEENCELMALCLMNIHSILDTFLPQFEKEHETLKALSRGPSDVDDGDQLCPPFVRRLRNLLRALSFPNTSVHTLLQLGHEELSADWLCSSSNKSASATLTSFSAQDWADFAVAQQQQQTGQASESRSDMYASSGASEKKTGGDRVVGRSQSLLAVHIEDNLEEYEI